MNANPSAWFQPKGSFRYKTENPANTISVITSCMVLSCAALYTALPQRLAGTASQYSKNAMPQLTMMASGSQLSLYFRWPYQANVMKTLEANSITTGNTEGEMVGMDILSSLSPKHMSAEPCSNRNPYHLIEEIDKAASIRSTAS